MKVEAFGIEYTVTWWDGLGILAILAILGTLALAGLVFWRGRR